MAFVQAAFRGALAWASNFAPVDVYGYASVEHAYQASKFEKGSAHRATIRVLPVNKTGQYARDNIAAQRAIDPIPAMLTLLRAKFAHQYFAALLLATGEQKLVEVNGWHDQFWGDCQCSTHEACATPGRNLLGELLMQLRSEMLANQPVDQLPEAPAPKKKSRVKFTPAPTQEALAL